ELALALKVGRGVGESDVRLLQRRGGFIASGYEVAVIELGEELALRDAIGDADVEPFDDTGNPGAHPHFRAYTRLDDAGGLHDVADVAPNRARQLRTGCLIARLGPHRTAPGERRDRETSQHRSCKGDSSQWRPSVPRVQPKRFSLVSRTFHFVTRQQ